MPAAPSVVIATPFYMVQGFSPYIRSLVQTTRALEAAGIPWDYWEISGGAYVDDVRNEFASRFLTDSDADALVFIDSDMEWDVEGFFRLLTADADVVGGCYPMKNNWTAWTCIWATEDGVPVGRARADGNGPLVKAERLSGGFLKVTRRALERMRDADPDAWYSVRAAHDTSEGEKPRLYDFFTRRREGRHHLGEDFAFSERWKACGGDLWIEPQISFGHVGTKTWTGNLDGYLRGLKATQDAEATGDIAAMARLCGFEV